MSLSTATCLTFARSLLVVAVALPISNTLQHALRTSEARRLFVSLLIIPVVAPRMMTGYGYANFSLSLLPHPYWNELLYDVLLVMTVVPVGAVMRYYAPNPPIDATGQHCFRLLSAAQTGNSKARLGDRLRMAIAGPWSTYLLAACLMFILAYQEFELASLMSISSWTVWLFDAQTGGLYLSESLRLALIPLAFELMILLPAGITLIMNARLVGPPQETARPVTKRTIRFAWCYLWLTLAIYCLLPWWQIARSAASGFSQLVVQFALGKEILTGILFAFAAAGLTYVIVATIVPSAARLRHTGRRVYLTTVAAIPGLFGSLTIALLLLGIYQLPVANQLYDSGLPWLCGLVLFLLPRAVLMILLIHIVATRSSQHQTNLLMTSNRPQQRSRARLLTWRTQLAFHAAALSLLFFWAYTNLTTAAILSPTGIVSAPVRLYNLMHYGQSAVLSAMVVATFGIPVFLLGGLLLLKQPLLRLVYP